jgi:hypothetical protein
MWCWRRMEISWTDHVRNEEVLLRVKEQRNILHEISKRKANWIGHILCRNCLLQRVIEGKIKEGIEVTERWRRRRKELLDDLKERRGYSHLKEEAIDRTVGRARFGRGFGPFVRQTTEWMNVDLRADTDLTVSTTYRTKIYDGISFGTNILTHRIYVLSPSRKGSFETSVYLCQLIPLPPLEPQILYKCLHAFLLNISCVKMGMNSEVESWSCLLQSYSHLACKRILLYYS